MAQDLNILTKGLEQAMEKEGKLELVQLQLSLNLGYGYRSESRGSKRTGTEYISGYKTGYDSLTSGAS